MNRSKLGHGDEGKGLRDYSVCLTFLIRNKNQFYLIDLYRARPEFPELTNWWHRMLSNIRRMLFLSRIECLGPH